MSTLRILLDAAPDAGRPAAWTLFDVQDGVMQSGRGPPDQWPAADRREAVLAASCVRIVGLRLPPMPADRVAAAASYALEDQLAGPADEQHIAVSAQLADGSVEAIVVDRELAASLAADFDRVLAEPSLAPRPTGDRWFWFRSAAGGGFVRKPDGTGFATSDGPGVAAEVALALEHASRSGGHPGKVVMRWKADAPDAQQFGTQFGSGDPWRWDAAGANSFASATDLRQREFAPPAAAVTPTSRRLWFAAIAVAMTALGLHVIATLGEWATLRTDVWRARSALSALAREQGIGATDDPSTALTTRHADARHHAGLAAPADALPLLARAAPALAVLPAGTLKAATFGEGHWTFDFTKADAATMDRIERQFTQSGLVILRAANASGERMRVALAAGTP